MLNVFANSFLLTDRVAELESTIQSLEAQLEQQEQEATNAISQWQESFSEADDKCAQLDKELVAAKMEIEQLRATQGDETDKKSWEWEGGYL